MGARLGHLHTDPMKVKLGVKMLTRLIESGFLASQNVEGNTTWTLAERQALVLETDTSVSIAIVLAISTDIAVDWLTQATLALAASDHALDCGLQLRGELWLLWRYYDEIQDDEALSQGIVMQLAIARFLEKSLLKPVDSNRASLIGRTV
ncbi:hypothetical protein [Shewanella sp. SM73]|uniref:hypothetical protein n=1 Tax=Shewanella TaxID=22 RepID=UPI0021D7EA37|nr:hypothetical protein [Shewanella sp. SM73]MCU8032228.1 hypothetical protein [Shewanella sp. SM73]